MSELFDCGHDKFGHNAYYTQQNSKKYGPYCRKCRGIRRAKKRGTHYDDYNRDTHFKCGHPRTEANTYPYRTTLAKSGWSSRCKTCKGIHQINRRNRLKGR